MLQELQQKEGLDTAAAVHRINRQIKGGKKYHLDTLVNATAAAGLSLVLADDTAHLLPGIKLDTGATMSVVPETAVRAMGWRYHPTDIGLILADGVPSQVIGLTDPAFVVLAQGTPQQATALVQALVVRASKPMYQLLCGKDLLHRLDAYVTPGSQALNFQADAGGRGSVPIKGYRVLETECATATVLDEADELCCALADPRADEAPSPPSGGYSLLQVLPSPMIHLVTKFMRHPVARLLPKMQRVCTDLMPQAFHAGGGLGEVGCGVCCSGYGSVDGLWG
jgi:hypothetical protein